MTDRRKREPEGEPMGCAMKDYPCGLSNHWLSPAPSSDNIVRIGPFACECSQNELDRLRQYQAYHAGCTKVRADLEDELARLRSELEAAQRIIAKRDAFVEYWRERFDNENKIAANLQAELEAAQRIIAKRDAFVEYWRERFDNENKIAANLQAELEKLRAEKRATSNGVKVTNGGDRYTHVYQYSLYRDADSGGHGVLDYSSGSPVALCPTRAAAEAARRLLESR